MEISTDLVKKTQRWRTAKHAALAGFGVALLVALGSAIEVEAVQRWVSAQGALAPLTFVLVGLLLSFLCVPTDLLCVCAGVLFDFTVGLVCVVAANYLGQCLAYLVARMTLEEGLGRFLAERPRLRLVERALAARGAFLLFLLRLAPIPAGPTSYLVGATRMPFGSFAVANLGLIPVSFLSLSVARGVLRSGEGASWDPWVLGGGALALAALVYATIVVRRSLALVAAQATSA